MATTITIEDIVRKTTDLPSLPAAALRVMRDSEDPSISAASLAETLAQDQSLSARVLRLANSAYYGLNRQVVDLPEAVVVLGMRCVRNLSMVAATYPWLTRPLQGYNLGPKAMWAHSIGVAIGAQQVAQMAQAPKPDSAFTAGLLHDLGKLAMSVWLENKIASMMSLAQREGLTFDAAERKVLGFDHTEVGGYLAEEWNLPVVVARAIRYHHSPGQCPESEPIVDCVHVGDYLTMAMGFGLGCDGLSYEISSDALDRLHLSTEDLDRLTDQFVSEYERHESLFEELATV